MLPPEQFNPIQDLSPEATFFIDRLLTQAMPALTETVSVQEKTQLSHQEIERKFLVSSLPEDLETFPVTSIRQGYLMIKGEVEIRLRDEDGKKTLTRKTGKGVSRLEEEREISDEEFAELWPLANTHVVEKDRYVLEEGANQIFVDKYKGRLQGLVVAEVEFDGLEKAEHFSPPIWLGSEVTYEKDYKNQQLALHGVPIKGYELPAPSSSSDIFIDKFLQEGVDHLINLVDKKLQEKKTGTVVILVAGRTSSGKTSAVTENIVKAYPDAAVLSLDNYFIGNAWMERLKAQGIPVNWDHPNYLDFELVQQHIEKLLAGEAVEVPVFSFKTGERDGSTPFPPARILIVESIFGLHSKVRKYGDVAVFVDIGMHGSLMRRLQRDVIRTSMTPQEILRYYLELLDEMYKEHVLPTRDTADVILRNEYNPRNEAGRSGMQEAQVKFAGTLSNEQLRRAKAQRLTQVTQTDYYFLPSNGDFLENDEVMRIRQEGESRVLTYKGPRSGEKMRVRAKLEFVIDQETEDIFRQKYGSQIKAISKERSIFQIRSLILTVDKVRKQEPGQEGWTELGNFIELHGNFGDDIERQMDDVSEKLGLHFNQAIRTPYALM